MFNMIVTDVELTQDSRRCKHKESLIPPPVISKDAATHPVDADSFYIASDKKKIDVHFLDFKFNPSPQYSRMVRLGDGPFIQHVNPYYPLIGPSSANEELHPSSVLLDLELGTTVILVMRTSNNMHHPMHIHGHTFEVLDQFTVDTVDNKYCSIFGCRLTNRYTKSEISILKRMPYTGLLKDTVLLPAGGAVVIRFHVNNPGVWFAHCHILLHKEDGMAFIIREGGVEAARAVPIPLDSPACLPMHTQSIYPSCHCREDTDQLRAYRLQKSWICSREWLCHHETGFDQSVTISPPFHEGIAFHGMHCDTKIIMFTFFTACVGGVLILHWRAIILHKHTSGNRNDWRQLFFNQFKQMLSHNDRENPSLTQRTNDGEKTEISMMDPPLQSSMPAVDTVWVEFVREWEEVYSEIVNPLRCMEVVGLAALTGSVFYQVGEDNTHRGLRESISLLFFSVTLWTFTRMYPSIPAHYLWRKRVTVRLIKTGGTAGHSIKLVCVRCLVYLCAEGWWPVLFGMIAYPIAHMNNNISIWFQNIALLTLNNLCYVSFGAVVGAAMPSIQLGMVFYLNVHLFIYITDL